MRRIAHLSRRPTIWVGAIVATLFAAGALVLFQPWKLWVDEIVGEVAPYTGSAAASSSSGERPVILARGAFISHEHSTTGTAQIVKSPAGERFLQLEDLDTSNGPALRVWLSDAEVIPGRDGWHTFDDGTYVDLGALKGNKGTQYYPIGADVDLSRYASVTVWCDRFDVSFGAAALQ